MVKPKEREVHIMPLESKKKTYISQKDAAGRLMVSTGTIRKLIKENQLEAYRFGSQIRIVAESLDAYIEKQKMKP